MRDLPRLVGRGGAGFGVGVILGATHNGEHAPFGIRKTKTIPPTGLRQRVWIFARAAAAFDSIMERFNLTGVPCVESNAPQRWAARCFVDGQNVVVRARATQTRRS